MIMHRTLSIFGDREAIIDGRVIKYDNSTVFEVQYGANGRSKYMILHTVYGDIKRAIELYRSVTLSSKNKKRLYARNLKDGSGTIMRINR